VREADDVAARQVVQLDAVAVAPQRAPGGQRVQGEGLRAARVTVGQRPPARFVVDDHKLTVAVVDAIGAP